MNWQVFFTRLGSSVVFAAVMLLGLLYPNAWAILILALLIQYLCLKEFLNICQRIFPDAYFPAWIFSTTQAAGVVIACCFTFIDAQFFYLGTLIPILILLPATLSKRTAWQAGLASLTGLLYIAVPIGLLIGLRGNSNVLPLALVLMIWMNDTMAYLVGSFIGRTPFSAISPKKTWEGTLGGIILTIAGAIVWGYYAPFDNVNMRDWIALALCACIAGTAGDLLESKLKRMADIKDSGALMPGHGGALDRFDSLLVALPFAFCYVMLFVRF